jgi:hypothetical protein
MKVRVIDERSEKPCRLGTRHLRIRRSTTTKKATRAKKLRPFNRLRA